MPLPPRPSSHLACSVMTWLIVAAKLNDGVINLDTTGQDYPMLAGNLVALFLSMILCIILSYIFPQVSCSSQLQRWQLRALGVLALAGCKACVVASSALLGRVGPCADTSLTLLRGDLLRTSTGPSCATSLCWTRTPTPTPTTSMARTRRRP